MVFSRRLRQEEPPAMDQHTVVHALHMLLAGLLAATALRKPKGDPATGAKVLQHGAPLKGMGILFGIVMPVAVVALVIWPPPQQAGRGQAMDPSEYLAAALLLLGFGLPGGLILLYSFKTRILIL